MNKHFILFSFFLMMTFFIAHNGLTQARQETHAPMITHTHAADRGPYGTFWKIYIEAEDTETDMDYVAVVVNQTGLGRYSPDRILLDPQHRNHLKGFLQWNTFSSRGAALEEGTRITLRISIIDKLGHESKEVIFPFTFVSGVRGQDKLPTPFDEENIPRIGYISIDLINPNQG